MKQGKAWGETEEIFVNEVVSVNYLRIRKGGYCSEHRHAKKINIFFVVSGRLQIDIWRERVGMVDSTIIGSGERTEVPPGVWHRFEAIEDTECLEIYFVNLSADDIERRTQGGLR